MSSSMPIQDVVQHFTHIHPLTVISNYGEFICDGCNTHGYGKTYRCASCDYDLHDHCATCPPTVLSFKHPQHELRLVFKGQTRMCDMCDMCDGLIEGLYYCCKACGFDVHPLCIQLPQRVSHVPHPAHPLELSNLGANSTCMVCRGAIRFWRYKCGPCGLDVHVGCVNSSASAVKDIQKRISGSTPNLHPSQYHPNHGCGCGHSDGHTHQGQGQEPRRRTKRKLVLNILTAITVTVVSSIISTPFTDAIKDSFEI